MIESLAYIGFTSPHHDEWREFGTAVLGMELAPDGDEPLIGRERAGAALLTFPSASVYD